MMPADVFFRVDATAQTGGGHLARCLVLASRLAREGARARFLCARLDPEHEAAIARAGHSVDLLSVSRPLDSLAPARDAELAQDALASRDAVLACKGPRRLLVVDHYAIDARWERSLRPVLERLMVIDDLADRPHDCDLILDQAYGVDGARYAGLVPQRCLGLFGPQYALLRPEFAALRVRPLRNLESNGAALDVHVFFGSADAGRNTLRFAPMLARVDGVGTVRIAVSDTFKARAELDQLARRSGGRIQWCTPGPEMASHMASCDVALGAPGQATWERACLGLPATYVAIAANQVPILRRLAASGFCTYLGTDGDLDEARFLRGMADFIADRRALARARERSMAAVDGQGADRVAQALAAAAVPS
jgi:UDP-2,4-diacetamido-2,4,6-trideoxy-beta-L-altropyranose hydrolase